MFEADNVKIADIIQIDKLIIDNQLVTCITGQSGSGKSTFLRLLNNMDSPDKGTIFYNGKSLQSIDPIDLRRKITMVPQTPILFDGTIRDNLLVGLKFIEKDPVTDSDLNRVLKEMELHKQLDDDAADLSGGETQRIALARVMLLDAEVFLLDEPSSALDDMTAVHIIRTFIASAKQHNQTIIMVSHDRDLVDMVADNQINMDHYSLALVNKEV